jgi:hypothetical protein
MGLQWSVNARKARSLVPTVRLSNPCTTALVGVTQEAPRGGESQAFLLPNLLTVSLERGRTYSLDLPSPLPFLLLATLDI